MDVTLSSVTSQLAWLYLEDILFFSEEVLIK